MAEKYTSEWEQSNCISLLDEHDQPEQVVFRTTECARKVLDDPSAPEQFRAVALASLERRYDGGLVVPFSGIATSLMLFFGKSGRADFSPWVVGAILAVSVVAYGMASRPAMSKFVSRRLPKGSATIKAKALGGLSNFVLGAFGSFTGGGVILFAAVCSCLPFIGLATPLLALVQWVRNR